MLFKVGIVIQHRYWLGDPANNRGPTMWHQVCLLLTTWRSGLHLQSSTGLTHRSAHVREGIPSQHLCRASKLEDQPEGDRSHDAECTTSRTKVNGEDLPTTKEFTYMYLGSIVTHDGGVCNNIKNRLSKARNAFRMMNKFGGHPSTAPRPN